MIPNPFCLASVPVAPIASSSNHLDRKPDADTSATSDAMQTAIATGASSLTRSGSSTIQAAKKALRGAMKAKLQSVSEESVVKQSDIVIKKILQHPWYTNAKRVSVYTSMPHSELQTDKIIHDALTTSHPSPSKEVFLPYTPRGSTAPMRMLKLRDLTDLASLRPNSWGIREFDAGSAQEREDALAEDGSGQGLDLILMPVALALNEQILDEGENIPVIEVEDGHNSGHRDIKPDLILWPEGEIYLDDLGNQ
ncbi:hypothetical protein EMMF5_003858 [Cystobasidiomycetes sp. EMM_F5]